MNRSTSITPPAISPPPPPPPSNPTDDDDEIMFVSETLRTPSKTFCPSVASPRHKIGRSQVTSDSSSSVKGKQKEAASPKKLGKEMKEDKDELGGDLLAKEGVKRGKKRARDISKESEEDEREISADLKVASSSKVEDQKVGDNIGSPKKRGYKMWTLEEDNRIIAQLLKSFDTGDVVTATGRGHSSVACRFRLILRTALKGLHGEENAVLPGEKSGSTSS